jgi:ketosteroid isomerase-like protein
MVIMKTRTLFLTLMFGLATVAICAASEEQALRDLDAEWSKAAAAKDLDKTVSYYSDDATALPPNAPVATNKEAIRKIWKEFMELPGFGISWKATKVEVAKSGEIGFVSGTYEVTFKDNNGKPMTERGKYLEVFEKKNGAWKCGADIWNSDTPAPPAEKK